jgi:hypothetical protein
VLALLWVALPLPAQQSHITRQGNSWVEEITGSIPAVRIVKVNTDTGNVNVRGGQQQQITYVIRKRAFGGSEAGARRQFEAFRVNVTRRADTALLEGNTEGHHTRMHVDFAITVPRATELLKLSTDGGSVAVSALNGRVEAESAGGNVRVDDIGGPVSAETGGGNVEAGSVAGDLVVRSGGGNIRIANAKGRVITQTGGGGITIGSAKGVTAETGGGGIQVDKCGGELTASTGGGSMEVGQVKGKAVVRTGGGNIRLSGAEGLVTASTGGGGLELMNLAHGVRAETGAGPITAEFASGGKLVESFLQTGVGDIVVYLPQDLRITVRAAIQSATGHKIRSEFPDIKVTSEGGQWGPKTIFAEGALNGGGPVLKINTAMGNIDLRRPRR